MHRHITHNRCHKTFADFSRAILTFLRDQVPRHWPAFCDAVSDNFRVISPKDFRVLACAEYNPEDCRMTKQKVAESSNKPFCDGTPAVIEFKADYPATEQHIP